MAIPKFGCFSTGRLKVLACGLSPNKKGVSGWLVNSSLHYLVVFSMKFNQPLLLGLTSLGLTLLGLTLLGLALLGLTLLGLTLQCCLDGSHSGLDIFYVRPCGGLGAPLASLCF